MLRKYRNQDYSSKSDEAAELPRALETDPADTSLTNSSEALSRQGSISLWLNLRASLPITTPASSSVLWIEPICTSIPCICFCDRSCSSARMDLIRSSSRERRRWYRILAAIARRLIRDSSSMRSLRWFLASDECPEVRLHFKRKHQGLDIQSSNEHTVV